MPPYLFSPSMQRPPGPPEKNLWLAHTYLQYISGTEGEAHQWCLTYVQDCRFAWDLQPGFEFFEGRVAGLGIDRLGLDASEVMELLQAVAGKGARVPGTSTILRVARPWCALFEPAAGDEPMLPAHWLEGLHLRGDPESVWIGKRVVEQPLCPAPLDGEEAVADARTPFGDLDWSRYEPSPWGWKLRGSPPLPPGLVNDRSDQDHANAARIVPRGT